MSEIQIYQQVLSMTSTSKDIQNLIQSFHDPIREKQKEAKSELLKFFDSYDDEWGSEELLDMLNREKFSVSYDDEWDTDEYKQKTWSDYYENYCRYYLE